MKTEFWARVNDQVNRMVDEEVDAAGQMLLGELIAVLRGFDAALPVRYAGDVPADPYPRVPNSYRGYYDHIAFGYGKSPVTVREVCEWAERSVGHTFTGWKGGEFMMTRRTPVWVSDTGVCDGLRIVNVKRAGDEVLIELRRDRE